MRHYAAAGVREYWIVSPIAKSVEVYYNEKKRFELAAVYTLFSEKDLAHMDEDERHAVQTEIPVSLYDDFRVQVKDIFYDIDFP